MRKIFKSFLFCLFLLSSLSLFADSSFFPPKDKFPSMWYLKHLTALEETSIYQQRESNKEIFRFLWLRTSYNPIAIRLEILPDKTGILYVKRSDGAGGYEPGKLIVNETQKISVAGVEDFLELIKKADFWNLPTKSKNMGLDGAQWIIEGLDNKKYHIVDYWTPQSGPVREIGLYFLNLSGLMVEEVY